MKSRTGSDAAGILSRRRVIYNLALALVYGCGLGTLALWWGGHPKLVPLLGTTGAAALALLCRRDDFRRRMNPSNEGVP